MIGSYIQFHKQTIDNVQRIQLALSLIYTNLRAIAQDKSAETANVNKIQQLHEQFIAEIEKYLKFMSDLLSREAKKSIREKIFLHVEDFLICIKNPKCFQMYCDDSELTIRGLLQIRDLYQNLENRLSNVINDQQGGVKLNKELCTQIKSFQRYCMATKLFYQLNSLTTLMNMPRTSEQNQEIEQQIQQLNLNIEYLRKFINIKDKVFDDFPIVLEQIQLKLYALIFSFYKSKPLPFDLNFNKLFSEFVYNKNTATPLIQMYAALGEFLLSSVHPIDALSCFCKVLEFHFEPSTIQRQIPEECIKIACDSFENIIENCIDWDNSPFTEVLPAFILLQALKVKCSQINQIFYEYDAIKEKTQKLKERHWDQFKTLTKRLTHHDIYFKREAGAFTLTLTFGEIFKNKTFNKELRKLCEEMDISIQVGEGLKTQNLYEYPIDEVEGFVNAIIQAKQHFDELQANTVAMPKVVTYSDPVCAVQNQSAEVMQSKALSTPGVALVEPAMSVPTASNSHLYRKELETQKVKVKTRKNGPESNHNDGPTTNEAPELGFSERFRQFTIRPMQMLSNLANRFFVCMTPQASANNDACSFEIRERFKRLFEYPRQCTKKDQQGFKLMRLDNGQLTFVAKILASAGGKFRMYPVHKETNQKGDTLLCFDFVVNKHSRRGKNHSMEEIAQTAVDTQDCATSSTASRYG